MIHHSDTRGAKPNGETNIYSNTIDVPMLEDQECYKQSYKYTQRSYEDASWYSIVFAPLDGWKKHGVYIKYSHDLPCLKTFLPAVFKKLKSLKPEVLVVTREILGCSKHHINALICLKKENVPPWIGNHKVWQRKDMRASIYSNPCVQHRDRWLLYILKECLRRTYVHGEDYNIYSNII